MNTFSVILVFVVVWWLVLLPMLSRGVTSQVDGDDMVEGTDPGAPVKTELGKKFITATIIATVVTFLFWLVGDLGLIDVRSGPKPWDE